MLTNNFVGLGKREMKLNIKTSLLVGTLCFCSALANAARDVYVHIKMSGQGDITGSSSARGHEKWIELLSVVAPRDASTGAATGRRDVSTGLSTGFSSSSWIDFDYYHEVKSPRDAASGLATGKRMHKPWVTCCCAFDRAGQQLMQALMNHERCVEFTVCVVGDDGKMQTGTVVDPELECVSFSKSENGQLPMESLSFNYTKIEWDIKTNKGG